MIPVEVGIQVGLYLVLVAVVSCLMLDYMRRLLITGDKKKMWVLLVVAVLFNMFHWSWPFWVGVGC